MTKKKQKKGASVLTNQQTKIKFKRHGNKGCLDLVGIFIDDNKTGNAQCDEWLRSPMRRMASLSNKRMKIKNDTTKGVRKFKKDNAFLLASIRVQQINVERIPGVEFFTKALPKTKTKNQFHRYIVVNTDFSEEKRPKE